MEYRNKKTGAVISTDSEITGGNWEPVKAPKKPAIKKKGGAKCPTSQHQ